MNPLDIANVVIKFLLENWKFDYRYNYLNRETTTMHGIQNGGKTIKCNYSYTLCYCCYSAFSFGMKPQSGKYNIKFKINKISNLAWPNIVGITSENCENFDKTASMTNNNTWQWFDQLFDYIGWSSSGDVNNQLLPNGLYCGDNDYSRKNNIFRNNNFVTF